MMFGDSDVRKPAASQARPVVGTRLGLGLKADALAWLEVEHTVLAWGEHLVGNLVLMD